MNRDQNGSNSENNCSQCGFVNPVGFKFCGQCGSALGGSTRGNASAPALVASTTPNQAYDAERRHLTVLFCDLIDSVAWSRRLDPEDFRQVLGRYRSLCQHAIARYGGTHVRYIGDGVRAYFGYPMAHEDDAERAVRAGLEMLQQVAVLTWRKTAEGNGGDQIKLRVGIATGLVVAGRMLTDGMEDVAEAVGETPNLAARLQSLAAPNTMLVADATRCLLGQLFELQDLGEHNLKGFEQPVHVWKVHALRSTVSRYEATRNQTTPLVNRESELARLTSAWQQVQVRRGQLVLLRGEAGIGKSRLVQYMRQRIAETTVLTVLYYQCSPYHSNSALYPIAAQLERGAKIQPNDSPAIKRLKLQRFLPLAQPHTDTPAIDQPALDQLERKQNFILIAGLLGITQEQDELELTPSRRKAKLMLALLRQIIGLASQQPLLVVFEDLHWIDPSSLELLQQAVAMIQNLPVLMLLTARSEYAPPWSQFSYCSVLDLDRLQQAQIEAIVRNVAVNKTVPADLLTYVGNRAAGNPLYVEELTKTVLQDQTLVRENGDAFRLIGTLPEHTVPASLQDLLIARLDKLSPLKVIAQTAAVIGREFSLGLLAAVSDYARSQLQGMLERLIDADVFVSHGADISDIYTFRHALLQESAYDSLLRTQRQLLHQRIATVMEERYPHLWQAHPGVLARHFEGAMDWLKASTYWLRAGVLASDNSAYHEALGHLDKALQAVLQLPQNKQRMQLELEIQTTRGGILINTAGGGAEETITVYRRAIELSRALGKSHQDSAVLHSGFAALWGLWRTTVDLNMAQSICDEMLHLAQAQQDKALLLQAYHVLWPTSFSMGKQQLALEQIEQGLSYYPEQGKPTGITEFGGHDAMVCAYAVGSCVCWLLGYPQHALDYSERAITKAQTLKHAASIAHALDCTLTLAMFRCEPDRVFKLWEMVRALAEQHRFIEFKARAEGVLGWAKVVLGEVDAGIDLMRRSIDIQRDLGTDESSNYALEMLAFGYQQQGNLDTGLKALEQAEALEQFGINDWAPEVRRRKGEIMLLQGDLSGAEAQFKAALKLAEQQQARALQLRAALSLAKLHTQLGEDQQARNQLRLLYEVFTEGHDTPDLKQVRAYLGTT